MRSQRPLVAFPPEAPTNYNRSWLEAVLGSKCVARDEAAVRSKSYRMTVNGRSMTNETRYDALQCDFFGDEVEWEVSSHSKMYDEFVGPIKFETRTTVWASY